MAGRKGTHRPPYETTDEFRETASRLAAALGQASWPCGGDGTGAVTVLLGDDTILSTFEDGTYVSAHRGPDGTWAFGGWGSLQTGGLGVAGGIASACWRSHHASGGHGVGDVSPLYRGFAYDPPAWTAPVEFTLDTGGDEEGPRTFKRPSEALCVRHDARRFDSAVDMLGAQWRNRRTLDSCLRRPLALVPSSGEVRGFAGAAPTGGRSGAADAADRGRHRGQAW